MNFEEWFDKYAPTAPEILDECARAAWDASRDKLFAENAALIAERDALKARIAELIETNNTMADALGSEEIKSADLAAINAELVEALQEMVDFGKRQGWLHVAINKAESALSKSVAALIPDSGEKLKQGGE